MQYNNTMYYVSSRPLQRPESACATATAAAPTSSPPPTGSRTQGVARGVTRSKGVTSSKGDTRVRIKHAISTKDPINLHEAMDGWNTTQQKYPNIKPINTYT